MRTILVGIAVGFILWQQVQITSLQRRLARVETTAGLLLAGYKTEREHQEYAEEKARKEEPGHLLP